MAASECEREVRKRRERRDSGCAHERKERRPHSEERAPPPPPPPPPLHDYNRLESERRAERLSRARRPQFGGKRRRQHPRDKPKDSCRTKENECLLRAGHERSDSPVSIESYTVTLTAQYPNERSDSPVTLSTPYHNYTTEDLDLGALHRQLDIEEPARSFAAQRARPQETAPRRPKETSLNPERRLDKIAKKISVLKKSIAKHEAEFEAKNGHAITASDRITDVPLTRMYEALRRLQAEKRCIKADPVEYVLKVQAAKQQKERDDRLDIALKSNKSMVDVVVDIEEWLEGCRQSAGRILSQEQTWTSPQLAAEKSCVQRALLRLEAARGRPPAHSADRGAARHLYERYRAVKRALASRPDAIGFLNGELATIHEHEAMLFNTSVDSSSDSQEKPSDASQDPTETPLQSPPSRPDAEEVPSTTSSAKSSADEAAPANEGLHCLGVEELGRALSEAKLQKCVLRRTIKENEVKFELQNCRKLQGDDKQGKDDYIRYKAIKARIKLLNALINKQKVLT